MKLFSLFGGISEKSVGMSENQIVSVKGKDVKIDCLNGSVWVTWRGKDRTLKHGQTVSILSKGKVCIYALSRSLVKNTQVSSQPLRPWDRNVRLRHRSTLPDPHSISGKN